MKRGKKIMLAGWAALIVIQFIQPARNKSAQMLSTDLERIVSVPQNVESILKNACYDCHSNNTVYPWYANIQPFGWLLANHIKEGKTELNFSEFGSYSKRRQISKLNGIANSIKDGTMPLSSYTIVHQTARLSKEEKTLLLEWAMKTKDSLQLNR
jgi:hypothetical protein